MNVLLVHAHPEPASFTSALFKTAVEHFVAAGSTVDISDLYAMQFDPVASERDFAERLDPDYLVYALEQRNGLKNGTLSADIQGEIDKVKNCDLLILCFPIYWYSMPAILKGWIDRVFVSGLFYGGRRIFDQGGMKGKRALVCATLGGREQMFSADGIHDDLNLLLRPLLKGALGYTGFEVLDPFYAYHIPYLDDEARGAILSDWLRQLSEVGQRSALRMPLTGEYDSNFERRIS